jgi:hypothetical protein
MSAAENHHQALGATEEERLVIEQRIGLGAVRIEVELPAGILEAVGARNGAGHPESLGNLGGLLREDQAGTAAADVPLRQAGQAHIVTRAVGVTAVFRFQGLGMQVHPGSRGHLQGRRQPAGVVVVAVG